MDGPRTNWALYDLLCNEREKEANPTLINIGSCGLHLIHSAFNPLSANPTKWSNILKQFVAKLATNCLSAFDHFMKLELKGLIKNGVQATN